MTISSGNVARKQKDTLHVCDVFGNYPPQFSGRRFCGLRRAQARGLTMTLKGFAPLSLAVSIVVRTSASQLRDGIRIAVFRVPTEGLRLSRREPPRLSATHSADDFPIAGARRRAPRLGQKSALEPLKALRRGPERARTEPGCGAVALDRRPRRFFHGGRRAGTRSARFRRSPRRLKSGCPRSRARRADAPPSLRRRPASALGSPGFAPSPRPVSRLGGGAIAERNRWQERRDSNPQPPVLETGALPIELHS